MIIGICGKSGSGKSTLSRMLTAHLDRETAYLEIDKVGHKVLLLDDVIKAVESCFGQSVVNNNTIDRIKLGDIVFSSRNEMDKLTDITWQYMQIEIDKFLNKNAGKVIILDWILLPCSKYFEMCDIKILLDVDYETRKQRAMLRDNITENKFNLREKSGINYDLDSFDYVLEKCDEQFVRKMVKSL